MVELEKKDRQRAAQLKEFWETRAKNYPNYFVFRKDEYDSLKQRDAAAAAEFQKALADLSSSKPGPDRNAALDRFYQARHVYQMTHWEFTSLKVAGTLDLAREELKKLAERCRKCELAAEEKKLWVEVVKDFAADPKPGTPLPSFDSTESVMNRIIVVHKNIAKWAAFAQVARESLKNNKVEVRAARFQETIEKYDGLIAAAFEEHVALQNKLIELEEAERNQAEAVFSECRAKCEKAKMEATTPLAPEWIEYGPGMYKPAVPGK